MRPVLIALGLLLLLWAIPSARADEEAAEPAGTAWERRLSDALARARAEAKPVLVLCHFALAPASKHLVEVAYPDPEVAAAVAERFVPLLLDGDAIDSAESGNEALSRFSVSFFPTHLVLDADARVLATSRGTSGTTPARLAAWLVRLGQDLDTFRTEEARAAADPEDAEALLALLQTRLDLATRTENLRGGWIAVQPPASAYHRQIDAVMEEAEQAAKALGAKGSARAGRAWTIWASACLVAGRRRDEALRRVDRLLDDLAAETAHTAFYVAHALYESDPAAALPYLRRVIAQGPAHAPYWQARAYEAYAHGRIGKRDEAKALYRKILDEGPQDERWVRWSKAHLERVEAWEKKQAAGEEGGPGD